MGSLEINKILAAVLVAILLIKVSTTLSEGLVHPEDLDTLAIPSKIAEVEVVEEAPTEAEPTAAMLLASASIDKGARLFGRCKSCHSVDKGGKNGTGPNLYAIVGAPVGGKDGFKYSNALASHGGVWDYDMLDAWLANPKNAIAGNKMSFAGVGKVGQRADLIAYLRSLSDTPVPLPEIEESAEPVTPEVGE